MNFPPVPAMGMDAYRHGIAFRTFTLRRRWDAATILIAWRGSRCRGRPLLYAQGGSLFSAGRAEIYDTTLVGVSN